jgi:hypothetical protein
VRAVHRQPHTSAHRVAKVGYQIDERAGNGGTISPNYKQEHDPAKYTVRQPVRNQTKD